MIKVNLLSDEEVRSKLELFDQLRIGIILVVAVIIVILLLSVSISGRIKTATAENNKLAMERNRLARLGVEKKERQFTKIKKELETKIDVIWDLKALQGGPVHLLDGISRNLPDRVWLLSLGEKAKGEILIQGIAYSNGDVAQFMSNLESSDIFSQVELKRASQTSISPHRVMGFSLKMVYSPPKGWEIK